MNKLLVVFNTCGINRPRENFFQYAFNLQSILQQDFKDMKVAVSSCMNSDNAKTYLMNSFGEELSYNFIDDQLPVSITFNHTVQKCVEKYGKFDGYLYVDSGIDFLGSNEYISKLYELYSTNRYAMVSSRVTHDGGWDTWFKGEEESLFNGNIFEVPVGKAVNLHVQIFSNELFETYGNVLPDIFAGQCMESTFSFLCGALKKKWGVHKDIVLNHETSMDGASSGFLPFMWERQGRKKWDHLFGTDESILDIIERGRQYGMGYEELQEIVMHDKDQYDAEGHVKNDNLKTYIRDNLYLKTHQFDYNSINHNFY
ncbi:MAG: hypothetical protein ACXAAH_02800 [Promethearchaeota archaeon]|jgi:hypothetical protein